MTGALLLWWLAGGVLIGLALPIAAIMLVIDHRRHHDWPSTGLAVVWCLLAACVVGVSNGNMSPPFFGVPLVLLYATAWHRNPTVAATGVAASFIISALVLFAMSRGTTELHWAFVVPWLAALVVLALWRNRRQSATVTHPQRDDIR